MENANQRGAGIENGSEWSNGTVHYNRTGPTEKSGPSFSKLFWLNRTNQFSFRLKFLEILVEWITPCIYINLQMYWITVVCSVKHFTCYGEGELHMKSILNDIQLLAMHTLSQTFPTLNYDSNIRFGWAHFAD